MKSDPTFWILARATGFTAYVLLTCSVLAGLVVKSRPFGMALKPATATDLHRTLAFLSLGALGLHGLTLVLDHTVGIGLGALLDAGLAPYRPLWTGLGQKNWRRLHWTTYATFAAATGHGLLAGSDSAQPWALGLYLGAVGAVVAATAWRALVPARAPARPRPQPTPTEGAS